MLGSSTATRLRCTSTRKVLCRCRPWGIAVPLPLCTHGPLEADPLYSIFMLFFFLELQSNLILAPGIKLDWMKERNAHPPTPQAPWPHGCAVWKEPSPSMPSTVPLLDWMGHAHSCTAAPLLGTPTGNTNTCFADCLKTAQTVVNNLMPNSERL